MTSKILIHDICIKPEFGTDRKILYFKYTSGKVLNETEIPFLDHQLTEHLLRDAIKTLLTAPMQTPAGVASELYDTVNGVYKVTYER